MCGGGGGVCVERKGECKGRGRGSVCGEGVCVEREGKVCVGSEGECVNVCT